MTYQTDPREREFYGSLPNNETTPQELGNKLPKTKERMAKKDSYTKYLKDQMVGLIEKIKLDDLSKQCMKDRWLDQLLWLEGRAGRAQKRYYQLRMLTIIGGVIVPALVSVNSININNVNTNTSRPQTEANNSSPTATWWQTAQESLPIAIGWAAFVVSQVVAISAAVEEFFHYGERYRHYRNSAEQMKIEGWQFFQLSGPYQEHTNHDDAYIHFADRVENIIKQDVEGYISELAQEKTQADAKAQEIAQQSALQMQSVLQQIQQQQQQLAAAKAAKASNNSTPSQDQFGTSQYNGDTTFSTEGGDFVDSSQFGGNGNQFEDSGTFASNNPFGGSNETDEFASPDQISNSPFGTPNNFGETPPTPNSPFGEPAPFPGNNAPAGFPNSEPTPFPGNNAPAGFPQANQNEFVNPNQFGSDPFGGGSNFAGATPTPANPFNNAPAFPANNGPGVSPLDDDDFVNPSQLTGGSFGGAIQPSPSPTPPTPAPSNPTPATPATPPTPPAAPPLATPQVIADILKCPLKDAEAYLPGVLEALQKKNILDRLTLIGAIATIGVETGGFRPINEYGGPKYFTKMYEHRRDLGNNQPGDGARYHGRGYIQITGRANYREYGKKLGVDLEGNPELALDPKVGAEVLACYFYDRKVYQAARDKDWRKVRKLVNGGYNGWTEFNNFVQRALQKI